MKKSFKVKSINFISRGMLFILGILFFSGQLKAQEKVKFTFQGKEIFVFDSSRIAIKNNNSNVFIGNLAGLKTKLHNTDPLNINGRYNTFVGDSSGVNNIFGFSNSYFGSNTGISNIGGSDNAVFGSFAFSKDTLSSYNSCFGSGALGNIKNGGSNTALGAYAGISLNSGIQNILLGYAGEGLQSGNNNILLGVNAGADSVLFSMNNSICIGNYAGYGNHDSHKLFISNSDSAMVNPLIYGDFANDTVKIYGTLGIKDEYTFPSTNGSFGQVLANNGSGAMTWTSLNAINTLNDLTDVIAEYGGVSNMIAGNGGGSVQSSVSINNTGFGDSSLRDLTTGKRNNAFGSAALYQTTTGDRNNAMGTHALAENLTGDDNVAIGNHALISNTTGNDNIVIGNKADVNNLSGSFNTIIGTEAGKGVPGDSKSGNVMIGYRAGYTETENNKLYIENSGSTTPLIYGDFDNDSLKIYGTLGIKNEFVFPIVDGSSNQVLTTDGNGQTSWQTNGNVNNINDLLDAKSDNDGSDNGSSVFIGNDAGLNDDQTDNRNVGIGFECLKENLSGGENVAIGNTAIIANTTGYQNISIGVQSMIKNTIGSGNVAIGHNALYENVAGSYSIAIGHEAMTNANNDAASFDSGNIAIGQRALFGSPSLVNNTGVNNTAIGSNALNSNSSGSDNIAMGNSTLGLNTTGDNNVGIGNFTLSWNTTGYGNIALGSSALQKNMGNNNTAIGFIAGGNMVHGANNICMGTSALYNDTIGSYNIALGIDALFSSLAASENVAIGYRAGYNTTGGGNVFIGNKAGYNETGNHNLYIDNSDTSTPLIYGDFLNDSLQINGKTRLNCTSSSYDFVMTEESNEPALIPTSANYGYIGTASNYLYRTYSSQFYAASAADYMNWSDRRLKENIHSMDGAISRIMQLQPVQYDLKESFYNNGNNTRKKDSNRRFNQSGFIAQQLEKVYPNLVMTDDKSDLKAVSYVGLIPEMVDVIQKHEISFQTVKDLENENHELQSRITKLENQISIIMELLQKSTQTRINN